MLESRGVYRNLVGKSEGKDHLEDPGVDGRIILNVIVTWDVDTWIGLILLRIGTSGGLL